MNLVVFVQDYRYLCELMECSAARSSRCQDEFRCARELLKRTLLSENGLARGATRLPRSSNLSGEGRE